MNTKRLFVIILMVTFGISLFAGCSGSANKAEQPGEDQKKQIVLRQGLAVAEDSAMAQAAFKFAELVAEKSNGEISIEVFPNAILGDLRVMLEQLQLGSLDFVSVSVAFLGGFTDKAMILDLPFLFKNDEAAEHVLDGSVGTQILNDLQENGIVGLGWQTQGWRHLTANVPVIKPADLKGLKIRVMDNPIHADHFNTLGASATPMAYSEIFTGLQQGVIDGQENPYVNIKLDGFYEVQKYIIETGHIYDPVALVMSEMTMERLSEEHQQIIREAAQEACEWEREYSKKQNGEIKAELGKLDSLTIIELTPEQRNEFLKAAQPVYDKWKDRIGKDLIQKAIDLQKDFQ